MSVARPASVQMLWSGEDRIDVLPSPGSHTAVASGCLCPIGDNARGAGAGGTAADGRPLYWMTQGCPLHFPREENDD